MPSSNAFIEVIAQLNWKRVGIHLLITKMHFLGQFYVRYRLNTRLYRQLCTSKHLYSGSKTEEKNFYSDPSNDLQKWLKVPLFREHEKPFEPDKNVIDKVKTLFKPSKIHEIKFLKSVVRPEDYPKENIPEILFIGHSNVGKSSLISAMFGNKLKFGHTKTLNFFQVGNKFNLVDAPGYGINQPATFVPGVESYLKQRPNLQRSFLLIDASIGFNDWDFVAIEMLQEFSRPYALIMTKIDLAPPSRRLNNLVELQQIRDKYSSSLCFPQPFLLSNKTLEGIGYLQAFIAYVTFHITIDGL
uniref:EngB-type G domain-containing protein n=1 Tax=Strigamia maritima TaxID=126957 RepID=T1JCH7_STRMM